MRPFSAFAIALLLVSGSAFAQDVDKARLEELKTVGRPKPQTDLDTVKLASAHREQAHSLDEKTNGLFQAWLVSICQGCGVDVKPPAKELKAEDTPSKTVPLTTGAIDPNARKPEDLRKPEDTKQAIVPDRRPVHASIRSADRRVPDRSCSCDTMIAWSG